MEKVKVLKNIPGLLRKDDILISETEGADFKLDNVEVDNTPFKEKRSERHVSIGCTTVYQNIPSIFDWVIEDEDIFEEESFKVVRSEEEIAERVQFFRDNIGPNSGQEKNVVFNNLVWFVDWLTGKAELLK
jgi:hypothetical protein